MASREKDSSSSNLPQISSIELPSKKFWDFFLSVGDPNSVSREDGFSVGNTEASVCQFCEKAGQFTEEIARLKKLAETVEGGGKELGNQLMDSFQNYMASYGEVSAYVEKIQKKMGQIPTWGFTEPALSQLNKVSLGRMSTFVELTDPNVQLKDIKWLDDRTRDKLIQMRPFHEKLKATHQKMIANLGDDWKKYETQKETLDLKGKAVMSGERKIYSLYANSQSRIFQQQSRICSDFKL